MLLAAVLVIAAAIAVPVSALSSGKAEPLGSNIGEIKRQLAVSLDKRLLYPRWIACVPSGRRFEGAKVIRCNVNYEAPHILPTCSVLRGGRLLTNTEEPAIPCGPDNAGWRAPIETFR